MSKAKKKQCSGMINDQGAKQIISSPMYFAVNSESYIFVKLLLDLGVDFTIGLQCFTPSITKGNVGIFQNMTEQKMKIYDLLLHRKELSIKLHYVVKNQSLKYVEKYLSEGAQPSYIFQGKSVLHLATETGNKEILRMLLKTGVDPNIVDEFGRTAIDSAEGRGAEEMHEILTNALVKKLKSLEVEAKQPHIWADNIDSWIEICIRPDGLGLFYFNSGDEESPPIDREVEDPIYINHPGEIALVGASLMKEIEEFEG